MDRRREAGGQRLEESLTSRKHGLDESACAEVGETVRRLIARYQGGA